MDAQIYKQNGETFTFEQYGIIANDFKVSSIEINSEYGQVVGRDGTVDYGALYGSRTITIPFTLKAHDLMDFPLLRDVLFQLVLDKQPFYIRELRRLKYQSYSFVDINEPSKDDASTNNRYVGGKRYLVRLQNTFDIEQVFEYGQGELVFETVNLPFAESIGTTADIDNAELISLVPTMWEQGYWSLDTGVAVNSKTNIRTSNNVKINLKPNTEYVLSSFGDYEARVNIYDNEDNLITYYHSGKNTSKTFTTTGEANYSRISIRQYKGNQSVTPTMVGHEIKVSLKNKTNGVNADDGIWGFGMGLISNDDALQYTHTGNNFNIYNAGNVTIHPFEQKLIISISRVKHSNKNLELINETTGDTFKVNEPVDENSIIKIDGPNITRNSLQYLRQTNRRFITLRPGWNKFSVKGAESAKVSFDFPFYYL